MIPIEPKAAQVLDRLEASGFEAFIVGGFVRDSLLGRATHDIDIATSAKPEEVVALFEHTIPTGLQHGTVTVLIDREPFEVTTFRTETDYEQHRRPKEVIFVSSLEEDLKRRDFTINAIALDRRGNLHDPFGGKADLDSCLLRCVGSPQERFDEDALRMIRCVRFAANLSLSVDVDTWAALLANRHLLQHVAIERVYAEWNKLMSGPDPYRGLTLLADSGLLLHLKRRTDLPITTVWTDGLRLPAELQALPELGRVELRWSLLFRTMDVRADDVKDRLAALTFPGKLIDGIVGVLRVEEMLSKYVIERKDADGLIIHSLPALWKRTVVACGSGSALDWLVIVTAVLDRTDKPRGEYPEAVHLGGDRMSAESWPQGRLPMERIRELVEYGQQWLDEMPVRERKDLQMKGSDLIRRMNRPAGPWVAQMTERLLVEAALGLVDNSTEALLARAQTYSEE